MAAMAAAATTASSAANIGEDPAFEQAISAYTDNLGEPFRSRFLSLQGSGIEQAIDKAKELDAQHESTSRSRRIAARLSPFFKLITQYGNIIAMFTSYQPDPSALIWGGIMCILQLGSDYPSYFEKITALIESCAVVLQPLSRYSKGIFRSNSDVQKILIAVYGDVLDLLKAAYSVFVNDKGLKRPGLRTFLSAQWKPFEKRFGDIRDSFQNHMREFEAKATLAHREVVHGEVKRQETFRAKTTIQLKSIADLQLASQKLQVKITQKQAQQTKQATGELVHGLSAIRSQLTDRDVEKDASRKTKILQWLSNIHFADELERAKADRHPGTGEWLFLTNSYSSFINSQRSCLLWCCGAPGCGKTILAALAVQRSIDAKKPTLHAFCSTRSADKRSTKGILASLLKQLCRTFTDAYDVLLDAWSTTCDGGQRDLTLLELVNLLQLAASKAGPSTIIVDGLDECDDAQPIAKVLSNIVTSTPSIPNKILVTSRTGYPKISDILKHHTILTIDAKSNVDDLNVWVEASIDSLTKNNAVFQVHPELQQHALHAITEGARGMFLWAKFQIDTLNTLSTKNEVLAALEKLPDGLKETYDRSVDAILHLARSQKLLALRVLLWVTYAKRWLVLGELVEALAMLPGSRTVDPGNRLVDRSLVENLCAGLIGITAQNPPRVVLVHSSVREFLLDRATMLFNGIIEDVELERGLANVCLSYILYDRSKNGTQVLSDPASLSAVMFERPFRSYAHTWWADHLHKKIDESSRPLIEEVVNDPITLQLRRDILRQDGWSDLFSTSASPLHVLAVEDFAEGIDNVRGIEKHLETKDDAGRTPLIIAACTNNHECACKLIQMGADISVRDAKGSSAVHYAARCNSVDLIEILIDNGADLHLVDTNNRTPLCEASRANSMDNTSAILRASGKPTIPIHADGRYCPLDIAAYNGHTNIAKLLLDFGFGSGDDKSRLWTSLTTAASNGQTELADILVKAGAEINRYSHTTTWLSTNSVCPLHAAIASGSLSIAKKFIELGASLENREIGWTMIHAAALSTDEETVNFALGHNLDINAKFDGWQTPIMIAGYKNNRLAIRMLLSCGADISSRAATTDLTIFHYTAIHGNVEAIQTMIPLCANIDAQGLNECKVSALGFAAQMGHVEVARALIDAGADINIVGDGMRTPLIYAVISDHAYIVDLLLDNGADIHAKTETGRTALMFAGCYGTKTGVIEALIRRGARLEESDESGRTALYWASIYGNATMVNFLLSAGALVACSDTDCKTALHIAAERGHQACVMALVNAARNRSDCDINQKDTVIGITALHYAVFTGHTYAARLLLDAGADASLRTNQGLSTLHLAYSSKKADMIDLILLHTHDLEYFDILGDDVLTKAVLRGELEVIRRYIQVGFDLDHVNKQGVGPLAAAILLFRVETAVELIKAGADPWKRNQEGMAPIWYISQWESPESVRCVIDTLTLSAKNNAEVVKDIALQAALHSNAACARVFAEVGWFNESNQNDCLAVSALGGNEGLVQFFLDAGVDVNAYSDGGLTPLMEAALEGQEGVIRLLLKHDGIDIDRSEPIHDRTALWLSIRHDKLAVAHILLDHGADPRVVAGERWHCLHVAIFRGHVDITRRLLDNDDPEFNPCLLDGRTVLHLATESGSLEILEMLKVLPIQNIIDQVNDDQETALVAASILGHEAMVARLLSWGADPNVSTQPTALFGAAGRGHGHIVRMLAESGAAIDKRSRAGQSLLHTAVQFGDAFTVETCLDLGCPIDEVDGLLHLAATRGNFGVFEVLIAAGANIKAVRQGNQTPLAFALQHWENARRITFFPSGTQHIPRVQAGPCFVNKAGTPYLLRSPQGPEWSKY